jgi:Rieske Fe-S protein
MNAHDYYVPEASGRRSFLKWLTYGLGAAFAAALGAPAALFLLDPRHRPARPGAFKTVAKLSDLKPGVPQQATIREARRDAWTLHPSDIVGRVWLVRTPADQVDAFTVTCPHLGCSVNFEGEKFVCPCHNGTFSIDGRRADPGAGRTNPAPRDMDSLELQLIADPDDPADKLVQVKFLSFVQGAKEKIVRS